MEGGEGGEPSGLQVVVHNLPWSCTWQQLKDSFREWKVERADIVMDPWGKSRWVGGWGCLGCVWWVGLVAG